jgi:FrmR/RcnR family transcriptional regulator, repressor of frmRAB operon
MKEPRVAHLVRDKQKLIARVRRVRGQLDAVERALDAEAACEETLQLIASSRGAMNGLMLEVLEGHIRHHIVGEVSDPASVDARAVEQLVDIVRTYLK